MFAKKFLALWFFCVLSLVSVLHSQEAEDEESYFDIGEIVISATRTPHLLKDVAVSTTVVTGEDIEELNAQNVGEALQEIVGVRLNSYGAMGAASYVSLRGANNQQVLVLIDDMPINSPSLGLPDLSMYPVDSVERIEIIRGPSSSLYGANALGGVVNIITADTPDDFLTEAYSSYGTFNTQIYRLKHGGKSGNLGYFLTVSRNSSDGDRENSEVEGEHLRAKFKYNFGEDSLLNFSGGYSRQDKGVPGSTSWETSDANQDDERDWVDLTHDLKLPGNMELKTKVYLQRYWQEFDDPDSGVSDTGEQYRTGVDIQQNFYPGDIHALTLGINAFEEEVDINEIGGDSKIGGKQKLTTRAIYFQDEFSLDVFSIIPGIRYDDHSIYGSEINPRLSGLYRFGERTRLRASAGTAFRAPTVNDLYWRDQYAVGNPELQPEESVGYEVGVEHQFGDMLLGRIALFRNEVDELITWGDPDGDWVWEPFNVEKARINGVELELRTRFSDNLSGVFSYTYLDARDKGESYYDNYLTYRPAHSGVYRLRYKWGKGFHSGLGLQYTDSVYGDRGNTIELGSYFLLDAFLSKNIRKDMEIFLAGENLLNEEYQLYDGYPMPGIDITAGIKMKF